MDAFALTPAGERAELFSETAARRGVAALIVEKDFWVCWTLKRLFALQRAAGIIFKGGTSLSKAYGLIERFSEDIDISIDRAALGFAGERDPAREGLSATKRRALLDDLHRAASAYVADAPLPRLTGSFGVALGDQSWSLSVDRADPQTRRP